MSETDKPTLCLQAPAGVGHALARYLTEQLHHNPAMKHTWQEGIVSFALSDSTDTAIVRITPTSEGEDITISAITQALENPDTLFTAKQRTEVENAMDTRAGIIGVSGPTLGSTVATLYAIKNLVKDHYPTHIQIQPVIGLDTIAAIRQSAQRLPAFMLIALPPKTIGNKELWKTITQTALAGSVMVIGIAHANTPHLIKTLHQHIPAFLWPTLFQLTILSTPFPTSCPNCAAPVSIHPDTIAHFAAHTDPSKFDNLKSAHAPGCQECNSKGRGKPIAAVELCSPDHIPENVDTPAIEDMMRQKGMQTTIDDLIDRAHKTPLPLDRAAKLWKKRKHGNQTTKQQSNKKD